MQREEKSSQERFGVARPRVSRDKTHNSALQCLSLSHSLLRRHPSPEMQTFRPTPKPSQAPVGWFGPLLGATVQGTFIPECLSPPAPAHTMRPPLCSFLWLSRMR